MTKPKETHKTRFPEISTKKSPDVDDEIPPFENLMADFSFALFEVEAFFLPAQLRSDQDFNFSQDRNLDFKRQKTLPPPPSERNILESKSGLPFKKVASKI